MPDVLVIYSEATRRVRRVVSPAPKDPSIHICKGEAAILHAVGKAGITIPDLQDEVVRQFGPVQEDRYAIVDEKTGQVVDVVTMDPACDDGLIHETKGYSVVKNATASKRATFDKAQRVFIEPSKTVAELSSEAATLALETPKSGKG